MRPSFLTKQQLGRLTNGTYNPRFRPCIKLPNGRILLAVHNERSHGAIRAAKGLKPTEGEEGYTMVFG